MNSNEEQLLAVISDRFNYSEELGRLIYKKWFNGLPKDRVGTPAGSINDRGYPIIRVNGTLYREHQLVWLLFNKELVVGRTESCIDHIDRNPSNNRISNLRKVDQRQNTANRAYECSSGYNNIYTTPSNTYFVRFCYGNKTVNLWTHKTLEKAKEVVDSLFAIGNSYENALLIREQFNRKNKNAV